MEESGMRKTAFTEEQIAYALRQAEAGTPVVEVCRKLGVTEQTFSRWKRKFAGMGVAELRRLRQLEEENRKLKQLVADLTLDKTMLQEVLRKKVLKPAQRREVVQFLRVGFQTSERRACNALGMARSSCPYRSVAEDQTPLRMRLRELAAVRVRYGYRRLHILLRREGWPVNSKRVYRLYKLEGLALRRRPKTKRVSAPRSPQPTAEQPGERWSLDFVADRLADGRRFRALTLADNVSRVSPAIEADFSLPGTRVVAVLDRIAQVWGIPKRIAVDNGPEFISKVFSVKKNCRRSASRENVTLGRVVASRELSLGR
jgi:putative transposase